MHPKIASATLVSLCLALSACGGGDGGSSPPPSGSNPTPPPAPTPPPPPPPADTTPPTVPANVTAVPQSTTSILVSWSASTDDSGISGYRVFRNGGSTAIATVQTTSYTDTNLTANTAYHYTVAAVDNAATPNVSSSSSEASATTPQTPASGTVKLAVKRMFAGLTLTAAHTLLRVPGDTSRWIVVQQDGHVLSFADNDNVSTTSNVLVLPLHETKVSRRAWFPESCFSARSTIDDT